MLTLFDPLRAFTFHAVALRIFLAVLCGGLVGIERTFKRRPAGFRTHILICLGAALTTLTGQYLLEMHCLTDPARLGAQVIAGVGFIGAGTIIVTRRHRVKGLTTAAGLWGAAIVGLALGAGFYEGGLAMTFLILLAELVFSQLEYWMMSTIPEVSFYVEYSGRTCLHDALSLFHRQELKLLDMEISRSSDEKNVSRVLFCIRLNKRYTLERLREELTAIPGILLVSPL